MWFNSQTAGLIGGLLGAAIGVSGGIWGALAGSFSRKGMYKKLILLFAKILIAIGIISLTVGIVALTTGQLYHVWYPFLLLGIIGCGVIIPNYIAIKKIYEKNIYPAQS